MNAETTASPAIHTHDIRPKKPLPKGGGTGSDFAHFLRTQTILDPEELKAFADDLEHAHRVMNQAPESSWDS